MAKRRADVYRCAKKSKEQCNSPLTPMHRLGHRYWEVRDTESTRLLG
jgi:hypothetical protein